MKFKLPLIAVMVGALALSACGGGGSASTTVTVSSPASLVINDVTVGTGLTVVAGTSATITYSVFLYKADATDFKGTQVDSGPYTFTAGANPAVITGVGTGVIGMKVGGHRILLIPAAQAYGASGSGAIPPNSGIVFDMTLVSAR